MFLATICLVCSFNFAESTPPKNSMESYYDEVLAKLKVSPCSSNCVCGCNEGQPCTCKSKTVTETQYQLIANQLVPISGSQCVGGSCSSSSAGAVRTFRRR